jgi:hypothetical protein
VIQIIWNVRVTDAGRFPEHTNSGREKQKMKRTIIIHAVAVLVLASAVTVLADVKVREKQTAAGQTTENTTYIKGRRQRTETMNGAMVSITQCDARREIRVNPALRTYSISPFDDDGAEAAGSAASSRGAGAPVVKGGTLTITSTIKDTGERKQIFGYTARRILTNVVFASSPDACSVNNTRIETDGWYIDDNFGFDCGDTAARFRMPAVNGRGGCQDRFVTKTVGTAKKGFAVLENMAIYNGDEETAFRISKEVVELSKAELDPSLFDIPEGYSLAKDDAALFDPGTLASSGPPRGAAPTVSNLPVPASPVSNEASESIDRKKKEGVIRIGLAEMKVASTGDNLSAEDLAVAFRNTLTDYLKMPGVEVVLLVSQYPSEIVAEAKQYECDFVIYGQIDHKKGGGGLGGMFGKVIAPAISSAGGTPTGSVAGNIAAGAAAGAAITAGSIAANVKSKDEMTFQLRMVRADGSVAVSKQFKRKARSNGEDLITPVVEEAASTVSATMNK